MSLYTPASGRNAIYVEDLVCVLETKRTDSARAYWDTLTDTSIDTLPQHPGFQPSCSGIYQCGQKYLHRPVPGRRLRRGRPYSSPPAEAPQYSCGSLMSTTADRRHKSPSSSRSSIGPYVAPSSLLSQPISAGQAEMDTLSAELELTPATGSSSTASKAPQPSSKAPWQTLTAADLSQPWADMTDSSDDESPPLHSLHAPPSSSFRRDSVGLLSAHLGSTHLSLASVESPNLPGRTGLHRNSSVAQPVRTQIGFNLAHGDTGDVSSPGSVEGRPHPRSLRAVPSALSILNKEAPAVVQFEPHLEAVRQTGEDSAAADMLSRAAAGLKAGRVPEAPREGMGGTYFVSDTAGAKVGIFKPCDEEPMAPNNPKGWSGRAMGDPGMKPGVRVGEAALREVAAYLLDHDGFAGVPPACLVSMRHPALSYGAGGEGTAAAAVDADSLADLSDGVAGGSTVPDQRLMAPVPPGGLKLGSLQAFAAHESDANDVAPQRYCSDSVHRIGVLDIRLLNLDRHAGNLLVSDVSRSCARLGLEAVGGPQLHSLVPIDHGYALPEALHNPYFEWQYWPQASVPFSDEVRAYVEQLDGAADAAMLARRLPELRPESLRCLLVTTMVLKKCIAAGLTLFEMAAMMTRPVESAPSDFEALCMDAREAALQASALLFEGISVPLFCALDGDAAQSGSLAMSGFGDSLGVFSDTSPARLVPPPATGGGGGSGSADVDDASTESPCMVASAPRPVAQSWLRTAPLASSGTDTSEWGAAAFAGLRGEADTPIAGGSTVDGEEEGESARSELCMPPTLTTGPMTEARNAACSGRLGGFRRSVWEGRGQTGQTSAYPPLLEAVHPDKANYVFSGLSEAQWKVFMTQLACDLDEELAQGTWRVRRHNAPVAASCPNPVKNHRF